jgi:hypothetical protein
MIPKHERRNARLAGELGQMVIVGNAYSDNEMQMRCTQIAADETVALDVRAMAVRKLDESMGEPTAGFVGSKQVVEQFISDMDKSADDWKDDLEAVEYLEGDA